MKPFNLYLRGGKGSGIASIDIVWYLYPIRMGKGQLLQVYKYCLVLYVTLYLIFSVEGWGGGDSWFW